MSIDTLYLASQSQPRRRLLELAGISHQIISHSSSEETESPFTNFETHVLEIAQSKIKSLSLPSPQEINSNQIFVLTADTLVSTQYSNQILGKPTDIDDARRMIRLISQEPVMVVTGCCLEKQIFYDSGWELADYKHWTTSTIIEYSIDEDRIDWYLSKQPEALYGCGGCTVDEFGQGFLKSVNGSYTSVLGLPLFELRQALKSLGFKF
jgi:septum formation protein